MEDIHLMHAEAQQSRLVKHSTSLLCCAISEG